MIINDDLRQQQLLRIVFMFKQNSKSDGDYQMQTANQIHASPS
jgi:hypothetical protein